MHIFLFDFEVQVASRARHTASHDPQLSDSFWLIYIQHFFYSNRIRNSSKLQEDNFPFIIQEGVKIRFFAS